MTTEWDPQSEPSPVAAPRTPTSKLAMTAGFVACGCPAFGGALGLVLGLAALAQIRASRGGLAGTGMAALGVAVGLLQLGAVGAIYARTMDDLSEAPASIEALLGGLSRGDLQGAGSGMAVGLRPALEREQFERAGAELRNALGEFEGVGARRDFHLAWDGGRVVEAEFDLRFARGAPAKGRFTLVREYGAVKVYALQVESPILKPSLALRGVRGAELAEFSGGRRRPGKLRDFKP